MLSFEKEEACHDGPEVVFNPWRTPGGRLILAQALPSGAGTSPQGAGRCQPEGGVFHPAGVCAPPLAVRVLLKHLQCQGPEVRAHLRDVRGLRPL